MVGHARRSVGTRGVAVYSGCGRGTGDARLTRDSYLAVKKRRPAGIAPPANPEGEKDGDSSSPPVADHGGARPEGQDHNQEAIGAVGRFVRAVLPWGWCKVAEYDCTFADGRGRFMKWSTGVTCLQHCPRRGDICFCIKTKMRRRSASGHPALNAGVLG